MSKRDQAKKLLQHYFSLSIKDGFDGDCHSEVADIVDYIVEAAKEELKAEQEPDPPDWMINEREDHERFEAND